MSAEYIYLYWIYSANIWGIYDNRRVSVRPSGAGSGKRWIVDHVSFEYIYFYWIYFANILGIFGGCLCALWALGWETKNILRNFHGAKLSAVPNCPLLACGAKLSAVPNCPLYTTVPNCPGAKLSTFTLRCQIVRQHGRCQIVHGAKLSYNSSLDFLFFDLYLHLD